MCFFAKKIAALKSKIALNHGGVILNILLFNRFFKLSEKAVLKSGIKCFLYYRSCILQPEKCAVNDILKKSSNIF